VFPAADLQISSVEATATEVTFDLTATAEAGSATLTFATALGADAEIINVADHASNLLKQKGMKQKGTLPFFYPPDRGNGDECLGVEARGSHCTSRAALLRFLARTLANATTRPFMIVTPSETHHASNMRTMLHVGVRSSPATYRYSAASGNPFRGLDLPRRPVLINAHRIEQSQSSEIRSTVV